MTETQNPLKKYFRTPKFYMTFPSEDRFYPSNALIRTENSEHAVYPMTARDELSLRTPDALVNGQATVDVIQSCIPDIKNAWDMPSIDIDACLIAIRMASYGDDFELNIKLPVTGEERSYNISLQTLLEQISNVHFDSNVSHMGMDFYLRPLSYREFTKVSLRAFEEQRIVRLISDDKISDSEKLEKFATSFKKLTDINVSNVTQGIDYIVSDGERVDNPVFIKEFVDNADKDFFNVILDHLEEQKNKFSIKPLTVRSTPIDIENGVPESFEVPITLDMSTFFGQGS